MARIYRATYRCRHANGALVQPSVHYQTDVPTGGDEPQIEDVASSIWGLTGTDFKNSSPTDVHIDELIVAEEVLKPDIGEVTAHVVNEAGTLGVAGDRLPIAACMVLNRHTNTRSRSARGWLMLPGGVLASQQQLGKWVVGGIYPAAALILCTRFASSFDLGTFATHVNPVVYSRTRRLKNTPPWTFRVTGVTQNPEVRWLSSRLSSP